MTVLLVWRLRMKGQVDLGPSTFVEWLVQLEVCVSHFGDWEALGRHFFIAACAVFLSLKSQVFVLLLQFGPQLGCHYFKFVGAECHFFVFLLRNLTGNLLRQAHLRLVEPVTWSHWFLHLLVIWLNKRCSLFPSCFNNVPNSYWLVTVRLKFAKKICSIIHFFFRTAPSRVIELPLLNAYVLGRTLW